jgi:hypothetical protein
MTGNSSAHSRIASFAAIAAAAFLLAGCFDVTFDIDLHNDGGGKVTVTTVLSKEMTAMANQGGKKGPNAMFLAKHNKTAQVTSETRDGRLAVSEAMTFKKLSDLEFGDAALEVTNLGRSFFGVNHTRIRWISQEEKKGKQSKYSPFTNAVASPFKGFFFTLRMHVPCNVSKASKFMVNGELLRPRVFGNWLSGSVVEWKIPLDQMIGTEESTPRVFEVECWSWYGVKAGKTR